MSGPDVAWYIALAAVLFGIGALGVLIRRNTLIVLLSLELMLNAGNLALIALSRHWHNGAGQIFALAVMAIAASEVCVGLGLVVAIQAAAMRGSQDPPSRMRIVPTSGASRQSQDPPVIPAAPTGCRRRARGSAG